MSVISPTKEHHSKHLPKLYYPYINSASQLKGRQGEANHQSNGKKSVYSIRMHSILHAQHNLTSE